MMNERTAILTLICMMLAITVFDAAAQDKFKVLATRGGVANGSGTKLGVGARLSVKDKVVISKGGYASLVHNNGRTVELKKDGSFKVADLDKAATAKGSNVSGKFASYVVNELTEVKEPIAFTDARRGKMATTGSVERLDGDEVRVYDSIAAVVGGKGELQALAALSSNALATGATIVAIMPRHTRLLDDTVAFLWHRTPKVTKYRLEIIDRNDKVTFSREVSDTTFIASSQTLGLAPNSLYYWHVADATDAGFSSDYYALYRLQGNERVSTEELIRSVKGELDDADAAVSYLILAAAFEDQGLMYDAHRAYGEAVRRAPDIRNYQLMYAEFLRRQNLHVDAYQAMK